MYKLFWVGVGLGLTLGCQSTSEAEPLPDGRPPVDASPPRTDVGWACDTCRPGQVKCDDAVTYRRCEPRDGCLVWSEAAVCGSAQCVCGGPEPCSPADGRACTGCTPQCEGRRCGADGCGGSCGACEADETCTEAGQCDPGCAPECEGRQCGDDGCGGACGACEAGETCSEVGQCEAGCVPDCEGRQCGEDGCGGACGECGPGEACDAAGQCGLACAPACTGRQCGDDGCGGVCGECVGGEVCDGNGRCVCAPQCEGQSCGDDGCGGSCGECGPGRVCEAGRCRAVCAPTCDGRVCGDDGCGGSCGDCPGGEVCSEGACCQPACDGRQCGDDGCGGICGDCPGALAECTPEGVCECTPDCDGKICGDDGCGGTCGPCGPCEACADNQRTCDVYCYFDEDTALEWMLTDEAEDLARDPQTRRDAQAVCTRYDGGGKRDWRLPTIDTLRSLIRGCAATGFGGTCNVQSGGCTEAAACRNADCDAAACEFRAGPSPDGYFWPDALDNRVYPRSDIYWSATLPNNGEHGWSVHFQSGAVIYEDNRFERRAVRCVRSADAVPAP